MKISKENELLSLAERNRELKSDFYYLMNEFSEGLWKYCRYLTGSVWDGEDLFQETMIKALGGFYQRSHPTNPKSYLYRIATNTWIDHCRRQKRIVGTLEEDHVAVQEFPENLEVEEALNHLIELFTPRQSAVFLLKEVFSFSAKEIAGIVRTTPGAVYATVRRMREQLSSNPPKKSEKSYSTDEKKTTNVVIKAYLKALNEGDMEGVLALLSDSPDYEASLGFQEYTKDEMRKGSMQFGLPGFRAEQYVLWGKEVIVVFFDGENGPEIHDIQYQEIENGKIVRHRSFYFRKELITAAAEEIGIPAQFGKAAVDW